MDTNLGGNGVAILGRLLNHGRAKNILIANLDALIVISAIRILLAELHAEVTSIRRRHDRCITCPHSRLHVVERHTDRFVFWARCWIAIDHRAVAVRLCCVTQACCFSCAIQVNDARVADFRLATRNDDPEDDKEKDEKRRRETRQSHGRGRP